jgi:hypothetical protein
MNLQTRVVNILTKPKSEWEVIAAEPTDVKTLYRDYIIVLSAIPAVCTFLGLALFTPLLGGFWLTSALSGAITRYVTALVGVYVSALVVEKLAPNFGSTGDTNQALKLVAYAHTPVWIGGVLLLVVFLAPVLLLAVLYAIYLFYAGMTPVMKTPQDKVVPYMVVSAVIVIVINVCLQFVLRAMLGASLGYGRMF